MKLENICLAATLKETLCHYDAGPENGNVRITSACEAVEHIAREFSKCLGDDGAEFLKACGLTP